MKASQIEFPLDVSVCAWCKPQEPGRAAGPLSLGICPRLLKKLKLEARGVSAKRPPRSRHAGAPKGEAAESCLSLAL